jgi:hypothetical protein
MSRTYKDKPSKIKHESWNKDRERIEGTFYYIDLPTTKAKKRKELDTEEHWMNTPGWWTRLVMNRPQRRRCKLWERDALKTSPDSLDDLDKPIISRKPHIYYW